MEDKALLLSNLRWDVDFLIKEPISCDYYWLKNLIIEGVKKGITECCQYDYECNHHKDVRRMLERQKGVSN